MATILEFRASPLRETAAAGRMVSAGPAEIVFFPGVRYERWDESEQPIAQRAKKSRRRDTLQLDD